MRAERVDLLSRWSDRAIERFDRSAMPIVSS
jgi:hypothetical protein